jgi:mutator protein MutT
MSEGKILLEKRRNDPGRGKWSIPGGKVELGEKIEQTVVREVKEETGLLVTRPELLGVVDNVALDEDGKVKYHFVIIDYFVKLKGGKAKAASDAAELRWVPLEEVESYELTMTFREFFTRNLKRFRRLNSSRSQ